MDSRSLHVRWCGTVPYREMLAVQQAAFDFGREQHLFLCEHPHVFTHGPNADLLTNLRCVPHEVGAELVEVQRGGDVTYHGPGQLVGYPILSLPPKHGSSGPADVRAYIFALEQMLMDVLGGFGLTDVGRRGEYPGVWVAPESDRPRKIAAIGVRVGRGSCDRRTMHGFALNVTTDLGYMREHIVPCGIAEYDVTSLTEEGFDVNMSDVVAAIGRVAIDRLGDGTGTTAGVVFHHRDEDLAAFTRGQGPGLPVRMVRRMDEAGVADGLSISVRKPDWIRPKVDLSPEVLATKKTLRDLGLVTVCEEAGCPNLSECWADSTATFMVLGDRCTRACGFCLVDTRKPLAPDANEPIRVAEAVERMGLDFAVLTMVARDDLPDGGMEHVAQCVRAIRDRRVGVQVETLVSDVKGTEALDVLLAERPDVFNHNIETVARLQRVVRPSAGYARSLGVLARAKMSGLVTKSGLIVGMGETLGELEETLVDLAAVGVQIVTIGQYLRPTSHHLPVARWVEPHEFDQLRDFGQSLGIGHVQASPLTRSSYHAKAAHRHASGTVHA